MAGWQMREEFFVRYYTSHLRSLFPPLEYLRGAETDGTTRGIVRGRESYGTFGRSNPVPDTGTLGSTNALVAPRFHSAAKSSLPSVFIIASHYTWAFNAALTPSWVRMKGHLISLQVTPRRPRQVLGCRDTDHVWRGVLRAPAHGVQRRCLVVWCAFHFSAIRPGFLSPVSAK